MIVWCIRYINANYMINISILFFLPEKGSDPFLFFCMVMSCFHHRVNLVSFYLDKLHVYGAPQILVGERSCLCYRSLPSNQLC